MTKQYMHFMTGSIATEAEWIESLQPEQTFEKLVSDRFLIEVKKDAFSEWVESEDTNEKSQ